jgi:hypothetical protein
MSDHRRNDYKFKNAHNPDYSREDRDPFYSNQFKDAELYAHSENNGNSFLNKGKRHREEDGKIIF